MPRLPINLTVLGLVALPLVAGPALAQTGSSPGAPTPAPGAGDRAGSGIPQDGVIAPPPTRPMPQADVPAERPNSTPVIPPPGTPGGAPGLQPR